MAEPTLTDIRPWYPHLKAAPRTERHEHSLVVTANGTRTCAGGWQIEFDGIEAGSTYQIQWEAQHEGVYSVRDALRCEVFWADVPANDPHLRGRWDYLLPILRTPGVLQFSRRVTAPEGATHFRLRCTFRWATEGRTVWTIPTVRQAEPMQPREPARIAVVTGQLNSRRGPYREMQDNIDYYLPLCESACRAGAELIVLPEVALHWNLPGSPIDLAVPLPSPETEPFAALAREQGIRLLLGMYERDSDAVHNSAVLFGPDGEVEGRYRKVHLAVGGEDENGILPGDGFPVFDTGIGRIGCNICMDSSAAESARMVGLNGAELLLMPIMGDHRASRWSPGSPIFQEDRWKAILRTHAMDSQVCMVVARNNAQGSCIIDRKGDILAWNEGDADFVMASVRLDDGYRTWNGGCFRDVNWLQRRPHLYAVYVDEEHVGRYP